jgi:hypothetical protein
MQTMFYLEGACGKINSAFQEFNGVPVICEKPGNQLTNLERITLGICQF